MFGFGKNSDIENKIENVEENDTQPNLADILGAQDNDTNITAGVDAILDEDSDISAAQNNINTYGVDFSVFNDYKQDSNIENGDIDDLVTEVSHNADVGDDNKKNDDFDTNVSVENDLSLVSEDVSMMYDYEQKEAEETSKIENAHYYIEQKNIDSNDLMNFEESEVNENISDDDFFSTNTNDDLSIDDMLNMDESLLVLEDTVSVEKEDDKEEKVITKSDQEGAVEEFVAEEILHEVVMPDEETIPDAVIESNKEETAEEIVAEEILQEVVMPDEETVPDAVLESNQEETAEEIVAEEILQKDVLPNEEIVPDAVETNTSEELNVTPVKKAERVMMSSASVEFVSDRSVQGETVIEYESEFWQVDDVSMMSENPREITKHSGLVTWGGDKYQQDIRVSIEDEMEIGEWSLTVFNEFEVLLSDVNSEIIISKEPSTVRYAELMKDGVGKLKIFNQSSYKFVVPQGDFFTVQGNVICGKVDSSFSLKITDYVLVSLRDKLNKYIHFEKPMSGFIVGPCGVRVFFANAKGVNFAITADFAEPDIVEYIPSPESFDNTSCFVFGDDCEETEFVGNNRKNMLVINVGASLYGWNVKFEGDIMMSLKDALEYQYRYKKLPSKIGTIIHGNKTLNFFEVDSIKVREKTVYYSYGKN